MTSRPKRLHIPNRIAEFDKEMLVPLAGNFDEIQSHVAYAQARIEALEAHVVSILAALST